MATNFYGTVNIGTKVDVEPGGTYIRTKVESGGTYIEYGADKIDGTETEETEKTPLTPQIIKSYIDLLIPEIKHQNQWFAIYKPLVWAGIVGNSDYVGAYNYIHGLYPNGLKVDFNIDNIRKLDVDSLRKTLDKWNESDSPVSGARFFKIEGLAKAFYNMLMKHNNSDN